MQQPFDQSVKRPPMTQQQVESYIVSLLEDYADIQGVAQRCMLREDNFVYVAQSLAESWFKDRGRAIAQDREDR